MPSNLARFVVIFRARPGQLDATYREYAERLRSLALREYGCLEFTSAFEDNQEIALSYWPSAEHIRAWKQDSEHRLAQDLGRNNWYRWYSVEVAEIQRSYLRETSHD